MKKPSKKTRDLAILICAIAASRPSSLSGLRDLYGRVGRDLGIIGDPVYLACYAWNHAFTAEDAWTQETDAEAEALLRTGWSPS